MCIGFSLGGGVYLYNHVIFLFRLLVWWITLIYFQTLDQPCILEISSDMIIVYYSFLYIAEFNLLMFCWGYCNDVHRYVCGFLLLVLSLSSFGITVMLAIYSKLRSVPFSSILWRRSCKLVVFLYMFGGIQQRTIWACRFLLWQVFKLQIQFC